MRRVCSILLVTLFVMIFPMGQTALAMMPNESEQSLSEKSPYAYVVENKSDESARVKFIGNRMYHDEQYIGFGVNGKPMLSLQFFVNKFGFTLNFNPQEGQYIVSKERYSFKIKPGSSFVELYWDNEKVKEIELTAKPMLQNKILYVYSIDIRDLLGLISFWDNSARTWDVTYREYVCREIGFPTYIDGDVIQLKGILYDPGNLETPRLELTGSTAPIVSMVSSLSLVEPGAGKNHKYEMDTTLKLKGESSLLNFSLYLGHRIIFYQSVEMRLNFAAKELCIEHPFQLIHPQKGYNQTNQAKFLLAGSINDVNAYYPPEIVLFVEKNDDKAALVQEKVPIIDGRFAYEINLPSGEGLYKVTINSIMAGSRGPAYFEIGNFYVNYEENIISEQERE
ncbi:stalk domain-containing protein [Desulforamulus aeronauticus]|uniref:Copper amine oxidase N-terminal domain-containing protein n=1 Tax=Desulforamulus aeronauticus DSM 10349 TaxID=1121421 RepID=A0A1M6RJL3_9FIRM|nr:stalk domain-containing protein [Desulforamulus aeronauticus]SHK32614.1 Copper amine oxidase N-terminal domain-containing protein [Desulforamulus aeronauticus DSM 10349]